MNIPGDAKACANCRFFFPDSEDCRRHAPRAFQERLAGPEDDLDDDRRFGRHAIWPRVYEGDWCGEFQKHEEA